GEPDAEPPGDVEGGGTGRAGIDRRRRRRVRGRGRRPPVAMSPSRERRMVPPAKPTSYYGRPILKEPIWRGWIPAYFFAGGLAAGSSLLALGGRLTGDQEMARRARLTALAGISASAAFLVADLGRPARFANMLRVARP